MRMHIRPGRRRVPILVSLLAAIGIVAGASASEAARAVPTATGPVNTVRPSISGTLVVGQTLTASTGTWTGSGAIGYSYQWERCDTGGGSCLALNAVSSSTWTLVSADVGHTIVVVVTATDSGGSTAASSDPTGVITQTLSAPSNSARPTISGLAVLSHTLTASAGSWSGTAPIGYSYQWERCDTGGGSCLALNAVSSSTWTVVSADVGHTIRVRVTASNSAGSAAVESDATAIVTSSLEKPNNTVRPTVAGTAAIGQTLTASSGTWTGTASITYSYQWQRCDSHGNACVSVNAVSTTSYGVTSADIGYTIRVVVTAHNTAGDASSTSNPTTLVPSPLPSGGIDLGGVISVPATSVALPDRLVISGVKFSPRVLTSRAPFTATFRVTDTAGHVVRGALVYLVGLPYKRIAAVPERATGTDGRVVFQLVPTRLMPIKRGAALVIFVRARTPQGDVLAGASTRRLVQIRVR